MVSGLILPIIGLIGIIGNFLVMVVYGSIEQRSHSTNIYLAALALSDFCMIWTAIILYGLEAWRHHGPTGMIFNTEALNVELFSSNNSYINQYEINLKHQRNASIYY